MRRAIAVCITVVGIAFAWGVHAQAQHTHPGSHAGSSDGTPGPADTREAVRIPAPLAQHMLANMRDHLLTLQHLTEALAKGDTNTAAKLAEERLGMSSLSLHGSHDVAPYMPEGMQAAGTAMHRAASRFAIAAQDAGATGDVKPALAALAEIVTQCNACHAGYKLR